jgi:hypothetical protein
MTLRCTAALIALVAALAACGTSQNASTPTPSYIPTPTPTPTQITITVPNNESAYIMTVKNTGEVTDGSDDLDILNKGREFCGLPDRDNTGAVPTSNPELSSEYTGPPTLEGLIENPPSKADTFAITILCPQYQPLLTKANTGFAMGNHEVGKDVQPGTYRTTGPAHDCYWERSTSDGHTIANDMVTNAPAGVTVTILSSDGGFTSQGCGDWIRIS